MARDLTVRAQRIVILQPELYAAGAAGLIIAAIASALERSRHQPISLVLAGGSTPRTVYREIARITGLPWDSIRLWFGDERAVPPDHQESNFGMARDTLIAPLGLHEANVHRMEAERSDLEAAARDYEAEFPASADILLLGIGADGHTASLFPASPLLATFDRAIAVAESPFPPHTRMTITPRVIQRAASCIILAAGSAKAEAVASALDDRTTVDACPASLARQGTWVLDSEAASRLRHS